MGNFRIGNQSVCEDSHLFFIFPLHSSLTLAQDRNWWYSVCFADAYICIRDAHVWRENRWYQGDINLSASLRNICMLPIYWRTWTPLHPIHLLKFSFISSTSDGPVVFMRFLNTDLKGSSTLDVMPALFKHNALPPNYNKKVQICWLIFSLVLNSVNWMF